MSRRLNPQRELGNSPKLEGMLPIRQSSFQGSIFPADFETTGHGEKRELCGSFFTFGCLEVHLHKGLEAPEGISYQRSLLGKPLDHLAYFERRKYSCKRQACPEDWKDWASRETSRAARRLKAFKLKGRNLKPIHIMVSIPHADYLLNLSEMRVKVYKSLKKLSILGGMCIYHPKRWKEDLPYFSPHFHIIGYGWLGDTHRNYLASGYVVKNLRVRKSVGGTIWYQLSHAGVHEKHHTVTWFGCLSYNKLKLPKENERVKEHSCPFCKSALRQLVWLGEGSHGLPDQDGFCGYGEAQGWIYADVLRKSKGGMKDEM